MFIRPFQLIAGRLALPKAEVLGRIRRWLEDGAIKRFGVVVATMNSAFGQTPCWSMTFPDERVGEIGRALAKSRPSRCAATASRAACQVAVQPVLHDPWP